MKCIYCFVTAFITYSLGGLCYEHGVLQAEYGCFEEYQKEAEKTMMKDNVTKNVPVKVEKVDRKSLLELMFDSKGIFYFDGHFLQKRDAFCKGYCYFLKLWYCQNG